MVRFAMGFAAAALVLAAPGPGGLAGAAVWAVGMPFWIAAVTAAVPFIPGVAVHWTVT